MTKPTGMVMAAGAAFAAALIGLAPAARADEPDPFQLLFGDTGFNSWTTTADTDLVALSPTLASDFATSVDGYETGAGGFYASDPFTILTHDLDPSAFIANPTVSASFRTTALVTSPWAWITRCFPPAATGRWTCWSMGCWLRSVSLAWSGSDHRIDESSAELSRD